MTHRVIWKYAAVLDAVHVALDLALQIGHAPAPVNGRREKAVRLVQLVVGEYRTCMMTRIINSRALLRGRIF